MCFVSKLILKEQMQIENLNNRFEAILDWAYVVELSKIKKSADIGR